MPSIPNYYLFTIKFLIMGSELRKVAKNWEHPKDENGEFIPLIGRKFSSCLRRWNLREKKWNQGLRDNFDGTCVNKEKKYENMSYAKYAGEKPIKSDYMPEWKEEELTHIQLYENTTEGTPVSPIFHKDELEKLCEYASENCTGFAGSKHTKEQWLEYLKNQI